MFDIAAPQKLISAVPALLGFRPERSLVLLTVTGGSLGAVMRIDLGAHTAEESGRLAVVAAGQDADGAIVVIVDPHGEDRSHTQLIDTLGEALVIRGIQLLGAYVVDDIAAGGRWHCPDGCGVGGTLEDPAAGVLAAAAVFDGRRLYRNRGEMQSLVAQDPTTVEKVRAALTAGSAPTDPREAVELVIAAARALADGAAPTADEMAAAATVLLDKQVRDMLLAIALTGDNRAAEAYWAMLARSLPAPWRVEALALLAVYAFMRAEGPLAGIALDAALQDDASHSLASMLEVALQSGMKPTDIRALAELGYRLASEAGVNLPAQLEKTA
ncbi:DUF4192 domain-containing protein [soil metagenome]